MKYFKTLLKMLKAFDFTSVAMSLLKMVLPGFAGFLAGLFGRRIIQTIEDAADHQIGEQISKIEVQEGIDAVETAHDQTKLEEALGSPNAGAPAEYRDGVQERRSRH